MKRFTSAFAAPSGFAVATRGSLKPAVPTEAGLALATSAPTIKRARPLAPTMTGQAA